MRKSLIIKQTKEKLILFSFFLGWASYSFTLFNVSGISITVLLIASVSMVLLIRFIHPLNLLKISPLLLSTLLAFIIGSLTLQTTKTGIHLAKALIGIVVLLGALNLKENAYQILYKIISFFMIVTLLYSIYQLFARLYDLPFAFLPITNLQLGAVEADQGLQRGFGVGQFSRVSAWFAEPSDLGRFFIWGICFAQGKQHFSDKRNPLFILCIAGVLISQSLGGIIALGAILLADMWLKRNFRNFLYAGIAIIVVAVIIAKVSSTFVVNVVDRANRDLIANREENVRFKSFSEYVDIVQDSPVFGQGMASIYKINKRNVPVASIFIVLLIERGIVGTILFVIPFLLTLNSLRPFINSREDFYVAFFLLASEIYFMLTFGDMYFPIMYFPLGYALSRTKMRHFKRHRLQSS